VFKRIAIIFLKMCLSDFIKTLDSRFRGNDRMRIDIEYRGSINELRYDLWNSPENVDRWRSFFELILELCRRQISKG